MWQVYLLYDRKKRQTISIRHLEYSTYFFWEGGGLECISIYRLLSSECERVLFTGRWANQLIFAPIFRILIGLFENYFEINRHMNVVSVLFGNWYLYGNRMHCVLNVKTVAKPKTIDKILDLGKWQNEMIFNEFDFRMGYLQHRI